MLKSTAKKKDISAPFAPEILKAARRFADAYDVVLRFEDGEWFGHALEYPEAMGDGKTPAACIKATRRSILAGVATMLEAGESPPAPAREGVRSEQVNIRVTAEEKTLLETTAKQKGFRGLSDFIRTGALAFSR
jgi:predicted RNase H-like HicB family nuclease